MSERGDASSQDLEEGIEILGTVVVVGGMRVDLVQVASESVAALLHLQDVLINATKEEPLETPEDDGRAVEGAVGLGTNDASVGLLLIGVHGLTASSIVGESVRLGIRRRHIVASLLLLALGSSLLIIGVSTTGTEGVELLLGQMTLIKVLDATTHAFGLRTGLGAAEQERAHGDVPPAEGPVVLNDDAVQPGDEEDTGNEGHGTTDTDDQTGLLGVVEVRVDGTTLPDEQHGAEGGSDTEVDRDGDETLGDRVVPDHDKVLGDGEDDGAKGTSETGSDDPGQEDLNDATIDTIVEISPVFDTMSVSPRTPHGRNGSRVRHKTYQITPSAPRVATPMPMTPPMMVWVVETGIPNLVAIVR